MARPETPLTAPADAPPPPPPPLPPPASGLFAEVEFRRLLASCEDVVAGDDKGRPDLRDWAASPVFHHYVETLQEQLGDLEGSGRLDPALARLYHERARALAGALRRADQPAYVLAAAAAAADDAARARQGRLGAPAAGGAAPPRLPAAVAPLAVPAPAPRPATPPPAAADATRPDAVSAQARARLDAQGRVHEALTEELAGMAAALKTRTLAMEGKVQDRSALLDSADAALERSAAGAKEAGARATAVHRRSRMNFCLTLMILLAVGGGFAGMYIFIRTTSMLGYRAPRAVKTAPTPVPLPAPPPPVAKRPPPPPPPAAAVPEKPPAAAAEEPPDAHAEL